jgi:hypothetical protein
MARKAAVAAQPRSVFVAPTAPTGRPHKNIADLRTRFKTISIKAPVDAAFREAFVRHKLLLAHTHPHLDLQTRDVAVKSVARTLGSGASKLLSQPTPGGVGYGFFYTSGFKTAWGRGTSMAFDVVCPTPPSGNVNTWLYLTATNRSGLGVEAFVAYNGQTSVAFEVFDWARNDHWQTNIPFSQLGDYLTSTSAHGTAYQVLPIWNSTWMINGSTWRNQALLHNHVRGGWDLIYQYDYQATDAQQKTGWVGSWGPIVETFQASYSGTKQMGALHTQLISADASGAWGAWALLSASNSTVRTDNVGFHLVFLDPNYAFTVNS